MSDYNWCHNPNCHKIETQSRVRGSGDNKVLRTRKIKVHNPNDTYVWDYFCNQSCLFQFLDKFGQQIADTYSVKQPSETPIKIVKEQTTNWRGDPYTSTTIVRTNE